MAWLAKLVSRTQSYFVDLRLVNVITSPNKCLSKSAYTWSHTMWAVWLLDINPCASSPCGVGGTCIKTSSTTFGCVCTADYNGLTCQNCKLSVWSLSGWLVLSRLASAIYRLTLICLMLTLIGQAEVNLHVQMWTSATAVRVWTAADAQERHQQPLHARVPLTTVA